MSILSNRANMSTKTTMMKREANKANKNQNKHLLRVYRSKSH